METFKKELFIVFILFLLAVCVVFVVKFHSERDKLNLNLATQFLKNDTLKQTVNNLGQSVATQQQHIFEDNKAIEKLIKQNSTLSRVTGHVEATQQSTISNITGSYTTTVHDTAFIPINTKFVFKNKWIRLYGTIGKESVKIDTLSITNTITVNTGIITHLFKANEKTVEIINDNPYFKTTSIRNITLKNKEHWYNSRVMYFLGGVGGGIFLVAHL